MALLIAAVLTTACGKKGPPLLPYQRVPGAAEITSAQRVGNDVYLTVTVPTVNIDDSKPASVVRVEIYGVTATTLPPPSQFLPMATRVATIPVARYADPSDQSGRVVPDPKTGALQGAAVTVRDPLTADKLIAKPLPLLKGSKPTASDAAVPTGELRRYYMAVPFNDRSRTGVLSKIADVSISSVPDRVTGVQASMKGRTIRIDWEPSGGVLGFLLSRAVPVEASPAGERPAPTPAAPAPAGSGAAPPVAPGAPSAAAPPPGATLYNVYRELAADPLALPTRAAVETQWSSTRDSPVNMQPLAQLTFSEEVPFDERQRCYRVRAVRGTGAQRVESEPSDPACIVPVDVEPPQAVTSLSATSEEGFITLRWDPNGEEDLRGYLVLRSDAGDDTLHQLTSAPIAETRFTDRTVISGRMYTYVVHAADNRIPVPNVSDPAEISATAR